MSSNAPSPFTYEQQDGVFIKTLLLTDLVDSTKMVERLGDTRAAEVFDRHDRVARDLLEQYGGREIDKSDGFLMLFERPVDAVRFSLAYHGILAVLSAEMQTPIASRVGIHLGEVIISRAREDDIRRGAKPIEVKGIAVPTAARLMSLAGSSQTLLTKTAFDLARRAAMQDEGENPNIQWLAHGHYDFKGVDEPIEVCEVGMKGLAPLEAPKNSEKARRALGPGEEEVLGWRPAKGQPVSGRPNWILDQKLGEGSFGEKWVALNERTGAKHVFKFCFEPEAVRALKREVRLFRLLKESLGSRRDITQILDWQFDDAPYFLEYEYTEGGNLLNWAVMKGGISSVPLATRIEIVAQIADALDAAHTVGIWHKDIKPSNILIASDSAKGAVRAVLTDFGIAQVVDRARYEEMDDSSGQVTARVSVMIQKLSSMAGGSYVYHAPEIVEGKPASAASDIYSLGVVLYQLVVCDLSRVIAPGWEREIHDELLREDIARAVDRDPTHRPSSAREVAVGLRSLEQRRQRQSEEAESARRAEEQARLSRELATLAESERLRARLRRRVAVFSSLAGGLALAVIGYLAVVAEQGRREAVSQRDQLGQLLYFQSLSLAQGALADNDPARARQVLSETPDAQRDWEWRRLLRRTQFIRHRLEADARPNGVVFLPSVPGVAAPTESGAVEVWRLDMRTPLRHPAAPRLAAPSRWIESTPDGRRAAVLSLDGRLSLFAPPAWEVVADGVLEDQPTALALSRDGARAAAASAIGEVLLVGAEGGALRVDAGPGAVWALDFDASGSRLLAGCSDGRAVLVDAEDGAIVAEFREGSSRFGFVALSPDGSLAAASGAEGQGVLWQTADGSVLARFPAGGPVRFSPDGALLAAASQAEVRAYSVASGEWRDLAGHTRPVGAMAFGPGGQRLATGGEGGRVLLWNPRDGSRLAALDPGAGRIRGIAFSPDGLQIAMAAEDGAVVVGELSDALRLGDQLAPGTIAAASSLGGSSNRVAAMDWTGAAWLWDLDSLSIERAFPPRIQAVGGRMREGLLVASQEDGGRFAVRHADSGEVLRAFDDNRHWARRLAFDASAGLLAVPEVATVRLHRLGDSEGQGAADLRLSGHESWVTDAVFAPGGAWLATASLAGDVRVWGTGDGRQAALVSGSGPVAGLGFTPRGDRLFAAWADGRMALHDPATGAESARFANDGAELSRAWIDPSGRLAAAATGRGSLLVWSVAAPDRDPREIRLFEQPITTLAFVPGGSSVLAGSAAGGLKLVESSNGATLADLPGHSGQIESIDILRGGRRALTVSSDRTARVWDLDGGREVLRLAEGDRPLLGGAFAADGSGALLWGASGGPEWLSASPR